MSGNQYGTSLTLYTEKGDICVPHAIYMAEVDGSDEQELRYIIVRSASSVLASASNKLSSWVSLKMDSGWSPHGPPQIHKDDEKFYLIQAMIKS